MKGILICLLIGFSNITLANPLYGVEVIGAEKEIVQHNCSDCEEITRTIFYGLTGKLSKAEQAKAITVDKKFGKVVSNYYLNHVMFPSSHNFDFRAVIMIKGKLIARKQDGVDYYLKNGSRIFDGTIVGTSKNSYAIIKTSATTFVLLPPGTRYKF